MLQMVSFRRRLRLSTSDSLKQLAQHLQRSVQARPTHSASFFLTASPPPSQSQPRRNTRFTAEDGAVLRPPIFLNPPRRLVATTHLRPRPTPALPSTGRRQALGLLVFLPFTGSPRFLRAPRSVFWHPTMSERCEPEREESLEGRPTPGTGRWGWRGEGGALFPVTSVTSVTWRGAPARAPGSPVEGGRGDSRRPGGRPARSLRSRGDDSGGLIGSLSAVSAHFRHLSSRWLARHDGSGNEPVR